MERSSLQIKLIVGFFALLLVISSTRAQDAVGRIVGNVTDPSGGAVTGAKVTVTNPKNAVSQTTTTDKDGFYQVLSLPIGTYQVAIESAGFRRELFENQNLQINQTLRVDAKLGLGAQTETIEVTDQAANVETQDQTIGSSIAGETIQRAPLNGRNVLDLAKLAPGVTESNADSTASGGYSIGGGRTDSITYLLDGGVNNNLLNNAIVFNPNPDTIAEFRVIESNYSAEYGRNGGGIISEVTKSGTNDWHGSAFEFLRNDAFNANSFFNNANGLPRDVLKRNQYGGTFGGPITVPKLVHGRDRFFFFVGYQGQRLSQQQTTGIGPVFTPAELNGDFSQAAANGGVDPGVACFLSGLNHNQPNPKNDPTLADGTSCGTPASPFFQSDPTKAFNGIIDPTKINPISANYIKAGLIPTSPAGQANFQGAHISNSNELTTKFDFVISEKDKVSATLGGFRNPQLNPFPFATVSGYADNNRFNDYYAAASYSHVFTPNVVNEFRLYIQRNNTSQDRPATKLPTASQLGVGITQDDPQGPPNLLFDNGLAAGFSEQGPTALINNTFGFTEVLSYVHGKHNWKMGGGISAYQNNTVFDFIVNGEFDFNVAGNFGGNTATGNSFADFIIGAPSSFFQSPSAPSNIRSKSYYGFLQDEWRLTKRLTLNLGLRYEFNSPKEDTKGRSFSIIPGLQSQRFPNAPTGWVFPGDPGAPVGVNFPDTKNWAPRVGFAWDPFGNGKTSVRGGFGVFYDILKGEDNLQYNGQPPFFANSGLFFQSVAPGQASNVPYFTDPFGSAGATNPFPSRTPPSNLDFAAAGFLPLNANGVVFLVDPRLKTPYTYQYNLSVQRELLPNTVFELSYVGSSSHGLTSLQDINPFQLGTTDRILNLGAGDSSCVDSSGNSTSGVSANATCSFSGLPEFKNVSKANYNALQASLTKQISAARFIGRTYFTLAYTFSHSIDNSSGFRQRNSNVPTYNPNLFYASSDQDVRNRLTFSGGWDLPVDRAWSSGPKRLTQGWSLFPIVTWHTGFPFDVFARLGDRFNPGAEGPSGAGDPTNVHANVVGSLNTFDPRTSQTFNGNTGNYFFNPNSLSSAQCGDANNPIATCTPGPGILPANSQVVANPSLATYGTLPRNFFRGPGYINFDLEFSKTTAITERLKLEFRSEFFNIFNHANFQNPGVNGNGNNINSAQFGQITSTGVGSTAATIDPQPRIIQLALRLSF
ncbi:MAG TPA: TonB-dependent receptor [Candidatus Saccharimonadales bacterium]|nr:TonB-dependent receptor [Candidatus Saccharimonadales bacterium]